MDEISQCPRKRLLVAYNVSLMPLVYGISSNRVLDFLFSEFVLVCVCFICEFSNSTYVSRLFYYYDRVLDLYSDLVLVCI